MIYFSNSTRKYRLDSVKLRDTAGRLLDAAGQSGASLSLALVGDAAIRRLNREHRGQDRRTDVLSFALEPAPGAAERMLGDVVISLDRAASQARDYDASLQAEVCRLLIHGVLHVLGHDHQSPREAAAMIREERRLAAAIELPWPYD